MRFVLGVLKHSIVRGVVLNLTMIESVDLLLHGRELVGDFWWKNKMNYQRCNINMTIINFLGTWEIHRSRCDINITAEIFFYEFHCQRFNINLTESFGDQEIWLIRGLLLT